MLPQLNLSINDPNRLATVAHALSSPQRLEIIRLLNASSLNVSEIAKALDQPSSSVSLNINILHEAGLILTETQISRNAKFKLCHRYCDKVAINLFESQNNQTQQISISIPIGSYTDYRVTPTCGLVTNNRSVGHDNEVDNFFSSDRFKAELLWFSSGYVEYRVSTKNIPKKLISLEVSFEACSEAPFYRNDWKSDITLWLNDVEVATWTSPGDFGGRKGTYTPKWWPINCTQFGVFTNWLVTDEGTYMNHKKLSDVSLSDIKLQECPYLSLKIGVKDDAKYRGGINLFGSQFGDYNKDIIVKAEW
jgi:predicted transcriptional regulator